MVTINEFLELYSSKKTISGYTTSLRQFFDFLGVNPDTYFDAYKKAKTLAKRDEILDKFMLDVTRWLKHLENEGKLPKSIQCKSGCIRAYLLVNRVDLGRSYWKRMKITGEAVTQDRIPTKDELRKILSHLDLLGRAFLYLKISTGIRISDILALPVDAIDFKFTPPRVKYFNHKIKRWGIGFLTHEASIVVQEWIKNRETQLSQINNVAYRLSNKTVSFEEFCKKKTNKDLLFPVTSSSIYLRYWEALEKAGLDQRDVRTGIRLLHEHTIRKYFKTMAGRAVPDAIADALIGHTAGLNSLKTVYNRHGDIIDELAQDFLKVEKEISLTMEVTSSKELDAINEKLEDQEAKMRYLKRENEGLKALATGLQSLIYADVEPYVPRHLQPMLHGTSIGFPHAPDDPPEFTPEQFREFLKSDEFLKSKQYKEFLKKIEKNKHKGN